jgi:hypothetical protein
MSIKRTIECYICKVNEIEKSYGSGWPGWGGLQGKQQNGELEMCLCPEHNNIIWSYAQQLKREHNSNELHKIMR